MIRPTPAARRGFTLIELLIASAIATLLMLAIYSAFDMTVTQTDMGRERVANTDLARAVVAKMNGDLANTLGMLPPKSGQMPPDAAAPADGSTPAAATATLVQFQGGVFGTDQQLTLFVSKVPQWMTERATAAGSTGDPTQLFPPDLRRVTYYLRADGGLCRQERLWVTAAGTGDDTTTLDTSNQDNEVIVPEASAVTFEYLSGTSWVSSWDGGGGALDDAAATGPPRAIRVTLTLQLQDGQAVTEKKVSHVFAVRAAIGNATTSTGGQ